MSIAFEVPIFFPAPVPSGKAIFALQKHSIFSSSSAQRLYSFVVAGEERLIRKALLLEECLKTRFHHKTKQAHNQFLRVV